jgi:hypothetical protein
MRCLSKISLRIKSKSEQFVIFTEMKKSVSITHLLGLPNLFDSKNFKLLICAIYDFFSPPYCFCLMRYVRTCFPHQKPHSNASDVYSSFFWNYNTSWKCWKSRSQYSIRICLIREICSIFFRKVS